MAPHTQTPGCHPGARLESLEAIDCKEYGEPDRCQQRKCALILQIIPDRALVAVGDSLCEVPLIRRAGYRPFCQQPRIREWIGDVRTWVPALLPRTELQRIALAIDGCVA